MSKQMKDNDLYHKNLRIQRENSRLQKVLEDEREEHNLHRRLDQINDDQVAKGDAQVLETIQRETSNDLIESDKSEDGSGDEVARRKEQVVSVAEYKDVCYYLNIVPCSIVIKSLPTSEICLPNYGLNSSGTLALTQALKKTITVTKLDLSGNEIGVHGVKHLANLFSENQSIVDLNISRNYIGSGAIKYIIDLFKKNRYLLKADLSSNELSDEDGTELIEAIDDHAVTVLNLGQNKFAEKTGIAIGKWLTDNMDLIELNLSWNHLRKKGAYAVARGVWENNKLLRLNLSWNGFGNDGAEIIAKALTHNVILIELDLRSNRIGPQGFVTICNALKDNNSLQKLKIGSNNINYSALETVLKGFCSLNPLTLRILDVTGVTFKPNIKESIAAVEAVHKHFKCHHGFLNDVRRRFLNDSAVYYIKEFCEANKINSRDMFALVDKVSTADEIKQELKENCLELTQSQIDSFVSWYELHNQQRHINEALDKRKYEI